MGKIRNVFSFVDMAIAIMLPMMFPEFQVSDVFIYDWGVK